MAVSTRRPTAIATKRGGVDELPTADHGAQPKNKDVLKTNQYATKLNGNEKTNSFVGDVTLWPPGSVPIPVEKEKAYSPEKA